MGMPPSVIRVQEYDPSLGDLARWHEIDIVLGLDDLGSLPRENIIRVLVGGVGFGWRIPVGKEDRFNSAVYSGDDEYLVWGDPEYLYVGAINPQLDERRTAVESYVLLPGNRDVGRISRLFLSRDEWEEYRKGRSMPAPFVGVQVPDDHARQLGLM